VAPPFLESVRDTHAYNGFQRRGIPHSSDNRSSFDSQRVFKVDAPAKAPPLQNDKSVPNRHVTLKCVFRARRCRFAGNVAIRICWSRQAVAISCVFVRSVALLRQCTDVSITHERNLPSSNSPTPLRHMGGVKMQVCRGYHTPMSLQRGAYPSVCS